MTDINNIISLLNDIKKLKIKYEMKISILNSYDMLINIPARNIKIKDDNILIYCQTKDMETPIKIKEKSNYDINIQISVSDIENINYLKNYFYFISNNSTIMLRLHFTPTWDAFYEINYVNGYAISFSSTGLLSVTKDLCYVYYKTNGSIHTYKIINYHVRKYFY